jgi:prepilin-type N-terminal cleavage/methylation domain-containing protein/prepilin-type processing-associated H-X9-DG protein
MLQKEGEKEMRSIQYKSASQNRNRGFTLPEIAAVMACVAILAAILLPLFSRMRVRADLQDERQKRALCASNLKQIALGIFQYTAEYDGNFVPLMGSGNAGGWRQNIATYTKSLSLFHCPSVEIPVIAEAAENSWTGVAIERSYSMNRNIARAVNESKLDNISQQVMVAESDSDSNDNSLDPMNPNWDVVGKGIDSWGWAGHVQTANYLYADGHVKALLPVKTAVPVNQWGNGVGEGCPEKYAREDDSANWINCQDIEERVLTGLNNLQEKYRETDTDE